MRGWLALGMMASLSGCMLGDLEMRSFDSCQEYDAYMKRAKLFSALDVGGVDLDFNDILVADLDADGGRSSVEPDLPGFGASSWTDTNLQHAGVDEADLVKTDGTYMYAISGGKLVVSKAWPVTEATQIAALPVDGTAVGLYLRDTTVVVISTLAAGEEPEALSGFDAGDGAAGWREADTTAVTVFDVGNPRDIQVLRETYTTGALRESRRIDNLLYVVTTEEVGQDKGPKDDVGGYFDSNALRWLSVRFDNVATADGGWESDSEPACRCKDLWAPSGGTESTVTNVLALDLDAPTSDFVGSGIVGPAGVVYASPESLYLASTAEPEQDPMAEFESGSLRTELHKFALDGAKPAYVASTSVKGVVPDRFGLSENAGVLRVATMDTEQLSSGVTTLSTEGGTFVELDHAGGLAPGETMTAARFVGDLGYLVTYVERKDPLFALDLSDPEQIEVGGALEISGWSDYLHPMAERGKLLAVGTDFDFWGDPELTVSIFDVSDLLRPRLQERYAFEADVSEASESHHAFTYDPHSGFLTIPSTNGANTVLQVVKATGDTGIKPKGTLRQPAWGGADVKECRAIRRSVHMDGVVWAYSTAGLTAAELTTPETNIQTVEFSGVDPCAGIVGWDDDRQIEVP